MKRISTLLIVVTYFTVACGLVACSGSGGSGASLTQSSSQSLQTAFNVVETFDELQDWDGNARTGYNYGTTYAPKEADGSPSKWVYFTNDRIAIEYTAPSGSFAVGDTITGVSSGATGKVEKLITDNGKTYLQLMTPLSGSFVAGETIRNQASVTAKFSTHPKWIANHGSDYVWGGTGKSMRINYYDFSGGIAGFGPSRLGMYLGDGVSGKSGYKKIHLFMMVKFQPGFFKQNADGTFVTVGTLKFFDLCSGFTAADYWGTSSERAQLNQSSARLPQLQTEYGPNMSVVNTKGGGLSCPRKLFFFESPFTGKMVTGGIDYYDMPTQDLINHSTNNTDISSYYLSGDWFGLEIASDIGTKDNKDATTDFWIYDKNGNEKGHFSATGESRLTFFDHEYNKVTLGGNRICTGYGTCPDGQDNRWYADDFIIHNDRIGPTYFSMKASGGTIADTTKPVTSIASPAAGSTVSGTVAVSANASDNIGVSNVDLYVDGVLHSTDSASPSSFTVNTATLTNGAHTLLAKAYDAAGNSKVSTAVTVTVNNIAIIKGDVDGDGAITANDALIVLKAVADPTLLTSTVQTMGDVAPVVPVTSKPVGNGKIDINDVLILLRRAVGLTTW